MNSEWQPRPLGECVTFLSGNTPSKSNSDYWGPGTPWISAKDMKSFWVEASQDTLTPAGTKEASRIVPAGTTLLLTRGMTLHNDVPIVRTRHPAAFNQDVKAVIPKNGVLDDFVPYLLLGNKARLQDMVDSAGHGTGRLNSDSLKALEVLLPPLEEQRDIAELFSEIDERLSLLREANSTLEAIAKTLFKSWFVDFEPVQKKANGGRPEGLDLSTAALFPDSFEQCDFGLIPKGWRKTTIGRSFILTMGQSPPGDTYNEAGVGIPFYQGKTDFGFRFPGQRVFCTSPTRLAKRGDTLVSVRAPVGDVNLAFEDCSIGRGVASVRDPAGRSSFVLYCLKSMRSSFEPYDGEGTVFGSINKKAFEALSFIDPGQPIVTAFEKLICPVDERIEVNEHLIRTLTEIRDCILPRLISGQIRLKGPSQQTQE